MDVESIEGKFFNHGRHESAPDHDDPILALVEINCENCLFPKRYSIVWRFPVMPLKLPSSTPIDYCLANPAISRPGEKPTSELLKATESQLLTGKSIGS